MNTHSVFVCATCDREYEAAQPRDLCPYGRCIGTHATCKRGPHKRKKARR